MIKIKAVLIHSISKTTVLLISIGWVIRSQFKYTIYVIPPLSGFRKAILILTFRLTHNLSFYKEKFLLASWLFLKLRENRLIFIRTRWESAPTIRSRWKNKKKRRLLGATTRNKWTRVVIHSTNNSNNFLCKKPFINCKQKIRKFMHQRHGTKK